MTTLLAGHYKMLAAYISVLVVCVCVCTTNAATRVNARRRLNENRYGYSLKRSTRDTNFDLHRQTREVFRLADGESFHITEESNTVQGERQFKLKETYKGKDVLGASVTLTTDTEGEIILDASGEYVQDIHQDVDETRDDLSEDELYDILIDHAGDRGRVGEITGRSIVYDVYTDDDDVAHSAAVTQYLIETDDVQKRPTAIINTHTGQVLNYFDSLETCFDNNVEIIGGNSKIGEIKYGSGGKCLDMREENGICYLENEYVKIINMNSSAKEVEPGVAHFNCSEDYGDEINGAFSPVLDALYYGTQIGKMFKEWYNTEAIKGGLILRVHFSRNIMNAFWNGNNITFGDGRRRIVYPLVCMDIAAHEIAHGFTEQHSGLIYIGQAGGLNEAFADMTGEIAEVYNNVTDWEVGADIMYRKPMRYFEDPEKDGRSISHVSKYSSRLSPHTTSGIYNKVFYLLAHDYGLDTKEVYRVFLQANKMYWQPLTNFATGACDVMQAAYDVGQPGEPFARAFREVGIDVCDVEDHLMNLRHNKTIGGITVSDVVHPAFSIDLPEWRENLLISASTEAGDEIGITVFSGRWIDINEATNPLVEGNNEINHDVTDVDARAFIIRLSTGGSAIQNVQLKAGYTCDQNYTSSHPLFTKYYTRDCLGEPA